VSGRIKPLTGLCQRETLEADDPPRFEVDDRLVIRPQSVAADRRPQILLQQRPLADVSVHFRIEETELGVQRAGTRQRNVGATEQFVDGGVAAAGLGDPDAGADAVLLDADLHRRPDDFDERASDPARVLRVPACQTKRKFVIANPREHIAGTGAFADAVADLQQRFVATKVSIDLIELLELVETQQQHAHFVIGVFQDIADVVLKLPPVGQLRQRIAHRRGLRLKLGREPLRPLAALVADAAEAEHDQRHTEKVRKRRRFDLGAQELLQQQHSAPVGDAHVDHEADRENHQNIDDFPPGRRGQREWNETLGGFAQRRPQYNH
jgi:hypothetical protein